MLCAQRVVRFVLEGIVLSSTYLAEAHVDCGIGAFLTWQTSAPITLYLSHLRTKAHAGGLRMRKLTNLAVLYHSPVGK